MMLVRFGGDLIYDVDGLSAADRYDLEAADRLLKGIENREMFISVLALTVFAVVFLVSWTFTGLVGSLLTVVFCGLFGAFVATFVAFSVAVRNNSKTRKDVEALERMLRVKKGKPCVVFICERVINSALLARKLERAFANTAIALVAP